MEITNSQYKQFILQDIIRPCQSMVGLDRVDRLTRDLYENIPELAKSNPEWWGLVIGRLVKIYSVIDISMMPMDDTSYLIITSVSATGKVKLPNLYWN